MLCGYVLTCTYDHKSILKRQGGHLVCKVYHLAIIKRYTANSTQMESLEVNYAPGEVSWQVFSTFFLSWIHTVSALESNVTDPFELTVTDWSKIFNTFAYLYFILPFLYNVQSHVSFPAQDNGSFKSLTFKSQWDTLMQCRTVCRGRRRYGGEEEKEGWLGRQET